MLQLAFFNFVQALTSNLKLTVLILGMGISACGDAPDRRTIDLSETASKQEIKQASETTNDSKPEYMFGFDLRNGAREDARQYLPLLDYLSARTGYRFRLRFTKDAKDLVTGLASGNLHFAAIGAGTYLTAQSDAMIIPLVRGVNANGELGYRAILVAHPDSRLSSLQALKGRQVAFGSRTSTQGHWIPRIMFEEAGIGLDDLGGHLFTGSHRACAEAVIARRVDACGMQDTLAKRLIESGSVRELARSELYPSSGIFSRVDVPEEVRSAVVAVLVDFDPQGRDRNGLYHWERTEMAGGFARASADDYTNLRVQAERLGLLTRIKQSTLNQ